MTPNAECVHADLDRVLDAGDELLHVLLGELDGLDLLVELGVVYNVTQRSTTLQECKCLQLVDGPPRMTRTIVDMAGADERRTEEGRTMYR